MKCIKLSSMSALFAALVYSQTALAQSGVILKGEAGSAWGNRFANACVPDVVSQVNALRYRAEPLGFHPDGIDGVSNAKHWQSIQRSTTERPFMIVSRSHKTLGSVSVVRMGSRGTDGRALRSNRLRSGQDVKDVVPPSDDAVVNAGGAIVPMISPVTGAEYGHAGGMQLVGDVLAVAVETAHANANPNVESEVLFFDLADPANPLALPINIEASDRSAGNVGMTRLASGHYMVVVGGNDALPLDFYVSTGEDLKNPSTEFRHLHRWTLDQLETDIGDKNYGRYQNTQFVTQCDGTLFLLATHRHGSKPWSRSGKDYLDAYRIDAGRSKQANATGPVAVTKVAKRHLQCKYNGVNQCDLQAGAGVYVSADRELMLYAVDWKNSGPSGTTRFSEFRQNEACPTRDRAWITLYEHSGFSGRVLTIDAADYARRNFADLSDVENFGDRVSSMRWCVPEGTVIRVYEHDSFRGRSLTLSGSGTVRSMSSLNAFGFNDEISSVSPPRAP